MSDKTHSSILNYYWWRENVSNSDLNQDTIAEGFRFFFLKPRSRGGIQLSPFSRFRPLRRAREPLARKKGSKNWYSRHSTSASRNTSLITCMVPSQSLLVPMSSFQFWSMHHIPKYWPEPDKLEKSWLHRALVLDAVRCWTEFLFWDEVCPARNQTFHRKNWFLDTNWWPMSRQESEALSPGRVGVRVELDTQRCTLFFALIRHQCKE